MRLLPHPSAVANYLSAGPDPRHDDVKKYLLCVHIKDPLRKVFLKQLINNYTLLRIICKSFLVIKNSLRIML